MKIVVVLLTLLCVIPVLAQKKPKPTCNATRVGNCPKEGCGGDPEMNKRKNVTTRPSSGHVQVYKRADFTSLTFPATWKRGTPRGKLKEWGEGTAVEYEAFLVDAKNYSSGAEATNCNLKGDSNNDWHLVLQTRQTITDEYKSITAEATPRIRPNGWTWKKILKLRREKAYVKLVGYLFYDSEHVNESKPARVTHWEIHPVTSFKVCIGSIASCKAGDNWQDLSNFPEP